MLTFSLTNFYALGPCITNHTLISAPTLFGIYGCHLQWVTLLNTSREWYRKRRGV